MTKEEFKIYLEKKLALLDVNERNDVINEYLEHIDNRMSEGKSEEEAIKDFGNLDELVDEILSAYNINQSNSTNSSKKSNLDSTLDSFFDKMSAWLQEFTKLDVNDVVKLMFDIFTTFLLLFFLKIPFNIVESIGRSFLDGLFSFDEIGLGLGLANVWSVFMDLLFIIVAVLTIYKVVMRHMSKGHNINYTKRNEYNDIRKSMPENRTEFVSDDCEDEVKEESYYKSNKAVHNDKGYSVFKVIAVIISSLLFIPMIFVMIGFVVATIVLTFLTVNGFPLFGPIIVIIGLALINMAFMVWISSFVKGVK